MLSAPIMLNADEQRMAFQTLKTAAAEFHYKLLAVSIESWHAHILFVHGADTPPVVAGRLKTRMRQDIGRGRIWTKGFDKRYCYSNTDVATRMAYIQRHPGNRPIH